MIIDSKFVKYIILFSLIVKYSWSVLSLFYLACDNCKADSDLITCDYTIHEFKTTIYHQMRYNRARVILRQVIVSEI